MVSLRSIFKKRAYQKGYLFEKFISKSEVEVFLSRFREKYVSVELIRIGGENDGGYLVPDNLLNSIQYCFSPGVDYTANFEAQLSKDYGIKSFMADASVATSPLDDVNFSFIPKFLGSRTHKNYITLSTWVEQSLGDDASDRILQMDIEGGEYDVLIYESADMLAQFSTMIIEFHGWQNIFERNFFKMLSTIFEKIYCNFSICHVHPNNCCGTAKLHGLEIPKVLEITFIRNDLIEQSRSKKPINLPHSLDQKNVLHHEDLFMPKIWWEETE